MANATKLPNDSRDRFAERLRARLIEKYGQLPSAEAVARGFNLNASECKPILRETARRWIRGLLMPKTDQIVVLSRWLEVDLFPPLDKRRESVSASVRKSHPRSWSSALIDDGPGLDDVNEAARLLAMENIEQLMRLLERSKAWLASKP